MSKSKSRNIKLCLVGDMYVGKTSLASVFVGDAFREHYSASVGGHFLAKTLNVPNVILQIWDTAGMERFRAMLPHFMRGAECAVIVYDVSSRETFLSARDYWIDYVNACGSEILKVLVANKSDIPLKAVKQHEGRRLAEFHNMLFFETSAKYSINVDKMFTDAAAAVVKTIPTSVEEQNNGIRLETIADRKQKCCLFS